MPPPMRRRSDMPTNDASHATTEHGAASVIALIRMAAATALLVPAWLVRAPFLSELRPWLWLATLAAAAMIAAMTKRARRPARRATTIIDRLALSTSLVALLLAVFVEARHHWQRWRVLGEDQRALQQIGDHVMVGWRDPSELRILVEHRAIGGIFVTHRNVAGRSAAAIAAEIAGLQAIRSTQGLPPLWVATDQEGGPVSRLSPPLTRLPVLAALVRDVATPTGLLPAHVAAIDEYADTHGRELSSVGVNLNFAPVVDIDHGLRNPDDAYSRIGDRAISRNPGVVAAVAARYCDGLARHGVRCTVKHFPGLGHVFEDTHVHPGRLDASRANLEAADWVPYARLAGGPHFAMVGHVLARALDADNVASTSNAIVGPHLRRLWRDGPVITDDLCMGPIIWGPRIGAGGVAALEAGVDMLLVSWDGAQAYPLLSALLDWSRRPEAQAVLAASKARLAKARP